MYKPQKLIAFAIVCVLLLQVGSGFAYWSGEIEHINKLKADEMGAKIVENFEQGSQTVGVVKKEVSFQNNSSNASFLRVAYAETWQVSENEEAYLLNNEIDDVEVAKKNWTVNWLESGNWTDGGDGWFYYKKILQPKESTEPILESITFPTYSGKYEAYKDADYKLYFRMELLQASDSQSTLNSEEVNYKATKLVFEKEAEVVGEDVEWK